MPRYATPFSCRSNLSQGVEFLGKLYAHEFGPPQNNLIRMRAIEFTLHTCQRYIGLVGEYPIVMAKPVLILKILSFQTKLTSDALYDLKRVVV